MAWMLPPATCPVASLEVDDWYITSSGQGAWGPHTMPPTQTSITIAVGKPYPGCAIGYSWPKAKDIDGQELPGDCQPSNFTADGVAWAGM
jgi:hypothetical protein